MRDALLISIVVAMSLVALRRPWVGVMLWTWLSVMNPHEQFGWASKEWPVAMIAALGTLLGLLFTRERQNPFLGAPVWALLAFAVWITITLPFSIFLDQSLPLWERSMKIFLMSFVALALLNTREKINWFIAVIVFSIGFYGAKGGIFTLATGGNFRVWGPGGFIGGNNEMALAAVMIIPLMRYFHLQAARQWLRIGLAGAMALSAVTVLGSHSRGALLALAAMAAFLWWKGGRKPGWGFAMLAVALASLLLMPEQWWSRMETIESYQQDASAMGRINAWHMALNLALDRFFGGGFMVWTDSVFRVYAPNPDDAHAAHSIYFQVLGEHGFVGLLLFISIGVLTWLAASRLIRECDRTPTLQWASQLAAMVQVSMVGYAVGGAFLSLAYFDLPYDMMIVVVTAAEVVRRSKVAAVARPRGAVEGGEGLRATFGAR